MAASRTEMHRLQEMIRLHRLGNGARDIARLLRMGRDTIRTYTRAFAAAGVLEGSAEDLPELGALRAILDEAIPRNPAPQQTCSVERWRGEVVRLRAKGAGPTAIFDWLRLNQPEFAGSLSAIKRLVKRLSKEEGPRPESVAIPVETPAGQFAQVDFGYVGKRLDPERGVLRKSWLFVMTLSFSRHMYCSIVFDQKAETFARLHIEAFESFGGVPKVLVPDNLKSAVIRAAFGTDRDAVLNRTYCELARHYDFLVDPTPPREPKKKGKVESGVKYVKGNFFATHDTVDIHEDRRALQLWVQGIAGTRTHSTTRRHPIQVFLEEEREHLKPLPKTRWESIVWKRARVHRDSHVQIDGAFYSVPWPLIGQSLWVRASERTIEVHHEDRRIHAHSRGLRGSRSTVDEHLPEHRRDLRHRTREYWMERAAAIGPEVEELAARIFDSDDVLYHIRKVQAIVMHLGEFPTERARGAARRALHFGCTSYREVKAILAKGLDLHPLPDEHGRAWSQGSRFARKPTDTLFHIKEKTYGDRR